MKSQEKNCHKATLLLVKKEEMNLKLSESFFLKRHLIQCKYCLYFKRQSKLINKIMFKNNSTLFMQPPFKLNNEMRIKIEKQLDK